MENPLIGAGGGGGDSRSPTRTPDTLLSQDYVEILLGVSEGPIAGLIAGTHSALENFFVGDTALANAATGDANFADFAATFYNGTEDDAAVDLALGGATSNLDVSVHLAQSVPVTRTTSTSVRGSMNQIEVRLLFNQLVLSNDDGTFETTAHFHIEYKASSSGTWLNWNGETDSTVTGKTTSGYVKEFLIPVTALPSDDYDIRVTKLSADNGTTDIIDMTWESVQMTTLGSLSFADLALTHIYGKASNQFSSIPPFSGIYAGMVIQVPSNYNPIARTYDETPAWDGTFQLAYCNNPAWVLYALCTNTRWGLPKYYKNVTMNRYEVYDAGKWCDEMISDGEGGYRPRFTFNDLIKDIRPGLEMIAFVAGSFNAIAYDDGNATIRLKLDKYVEPVQIFTPENVSVEGFNYTFTDIATRANDITVTFVNPDLDYTEDRRAPSVDMTDYQEANGRIPFEFIAVGCTSVHEAVCRANYRAITANTECATVAFTTTRFGVIAELFDTIYVCDPDSGWSSGGRIKSVVGSVINFRDPVYFTTTDPVTMRIQAYDGLHNITVVPPGTGVWYYVTKTVGTIPTNVPDKTVFTIEDTDALGIAKPFKILSIVEAGEDAYAITALEVNVNKYTDAEAGTFSESVAYSYRQPGVPLQPSDLQAVSGTKELQVTSNGTIVSRSRVSWVRPPLSGTDHFELDYREVNSGTWETIKPIYGEETYVSPVKDLVSYDYRLFAVSALGMRCIPVELFNQLVLGKSAKPSDCTGLAVVVTTNGHLASWDKPDDLDWDLTGLQVGASPQTWADASSVPAQQRAVSANLGWKLAGTYQLLAKHLDTTGNYSETANSASFTVLAPSAPIFSRADVEENALKLQWQDCRTTQPLKRAIYRVGTTSDTYASATDYGTDGGEQRLALLVFNTPGTKRVFVAIEDVAGNITSTSFVDVVITLPTNYVLSDAYTSTFAGTLTTAVNASGGLLMLARSETWDAHFSTRGYSNTDDQVTAGYPLFFEPGGLVSSYSETTDLGRTLTSSTITVVAAYAWLAGGGTVVPKISYKTLVGDAWTDVTGSWSAVAANFRYIKVTLDVTGDGGYNDLLRVTSLLTGISLRKGTEAVDFTSVSTDATGTAYTLTSGIVDITSYGFVVNGTGAAYTDVIPDDSVNPPYVRVKAYNSGLTRVTASGQLTINGTTT